VRLTLRKFLLISEWAKVFITLSQNWVDCHSNSRMSSVKSGIHPNECALIDSLPSRHNQNQKGPVFLDSCHIKRLSRVKSSFAPPLLRRPKAPVHQNPHARIMPTQSWSTSTVESALLLLSAGAVYLSLSPPNPPVSKCECYFEKEEESSFFEIFVQSITWCSKVGFLSFIRLQNSQASSKDR
jgi:hypothetical protein